MKELARGVQFDSILIAYSLVAKSLRRRAVHGELGLDTVTATFHTLDRRRGIEKHQKRRNDVKTDVQHFRHVQCTSIDDLLVS